MKYLTPLRVRPRYYAAIEREINILFMRVLYGPVMEIFKKYNRELKNDINVLREAILKGDIYYYNEYFYGKPNSKISKALKELGATYQPVSRAWRLAQLPPDLTIAIAQAESKYREITDELLQTINGVDKENIIKNSDIPALIETTIHKMEQDFQETIKSVAIAPVMTPHTKEIIARQWGENLELYIKKWANEDVLKLRQAVLSNTLSGQRAHNLVAQIEKNYGSSRKKAKFLARQETALLMSKYQENRYADAGILRYKWSTSNDERVRPQKGVNEMGDNHRRLNGKIFSFANPPIVDRMTGKRCNPGEDYNCRCIAIPVVD